jgi:hypothetical protein
MYNRFWKIINEIRYNNPKTIKELRKLGIRCKLISSGAFRNVYKILTVPLVIKFPNCDEGKEHTLNEVKAVKKINRLRKYKKLRQFMPEIYHSNSAGVILMYMYTVLESFTYEYKQVVSGLMFIIIELIYAGEKWDEDFDVHGGNLGFDEVGNVVFVDLGYFMRKEDE